MNLSDAIKKYIDNTRLVKAISSVPSDIFLDQEGFYQEMVSNFKRIRDISKENQILLYENVLPLLDENYKLTHDEFMVLQEALQQMIDGYSMENLDVNFLALCCDKLLDYAYSIKDNNCIVEILDLGITVYYTLMNKVERIEDYTGYKSYLRKKAMNMANTLVEYLTKNNFKSLTESSIELLLINSRYMSALHEGLYGSDDNITEKNELLRSLSFMNDSNIKEAVPNYNWTNHEASIYEYFGYMTERNNVKKIDDKLANEIYKYCQKLYTLKKENPTLVTRITDVECNILLSRSSYISGAISLEEYKKQLMLLYRRRISGYEIAAIFSNLLVPCEYMLVLDKNNLTDKEKENLKNIYENTLAYASNISASETLSYILEYYSLMLDSFIEVEGMSFVQFALRGMAAFHLPTYVHSYMVAKISKCIMKEYIKNTNILKELNIEEKELLDFTYNAGLLHDVGKLPIIDTVSLYERKLFDDEFNILKTHPLLGARLLNKQEKYRKYANISLAHHCWHNEMGGYPNYELKLSNIEKLVNDVVTCADCMDASTDLIGRSYSHGITLSEYIKEFKNDGGRYALYLSDTLDKCYEELLNILENSRKEYYYEAFESLYNI
ncbi:MAG: HD-GYP domain-containing protein [Anaeroplasmataceae bacterium]